MARLIHSFDDDAVALWNANFDQGLKVAKATDAKETWSGKGPVMRRLIAEERMPGVQCSSDADLLAYARAGGTTVYHPTSTCRMGADPAAVVDERLRVRGFERLRVIDASIMPTVVSGNTHAAAVMIGEKGADLVLQDAQASAPVALSA